MTERVSTSKLDRLYRNEIKRLGKSSVQRLISEKRLKEQESKPKSIFLSHSHKDKTVVEKIALLFKNVDIDIYIDWMDEAMPKVTDGNTAAEIKRKIEKCHRFLFLATYSGLRSKWCDWELGLAYSIKKIDEIAILPIESKSGNWRGSEYLQLYPVMNIDAVDLELATADKISVAIKGAGSRIPLDRWLALR